MQKEVETPGIMRWEQLKGNSWASEQPREYPCVVDVLYNKVDRRARMEKPRGGSSTVGTSKLLKMAMHS